MKNDNNPEKASNFNELLDFKYGKIGSTKRDLFEVQSQFFVVRVLLKEARKKANLTQAELAEKIGSKKSYISRIENGKSDLQLSTFFKIIEIGLGKEVLIQIR